MPYWRGLGCQQALVALSLAVALAAPKEVPPRTELSHPCSRVVSRSVRKQLEKEVLKPAEKAGISAWPANCPWDPSRDIFGGQEKHKNRKRTATGMWTCGYCQKVFKSEHYLDLHMERKHMSEAPANGICLADYCEIFDVCQSEVPSRRARPDSTGIPTCNNETMARERRRCEESLAKCLPLAEEAPRKMHAKLSRHFCQMMDCRIRAEHHREQHSEMMPVIVLLILVVLLGFIAFSMTVCCVDYSDDLLNFLEGSKVISSNTRRQAAQLRDSTRSRVGMDRTKQI
mmetsp:Transcript_66768/g.157240  ORF Transcript_66768/g.157240 Transcript_66768/m.157240 type:complete len:286 (-) Transcript_66768:66-923(-)